MTKTNIGTFDLRAANPALILTSKTAVGHASKNHHSVFPGTFSKADRRNWKLISNLRGSARRDQILAETAHDLNNALTVVHLQLELLALDLLPQAGVGAEAVWHRLRLIQPAVLHAADILRELMQPDDRTPTRGAVLPKPIALNPVLQRMVPILSAMLPPGVTLHLRLSPDLEDVAVDPVQVVRIVSNLVLNSCAALARSADSGEARVTLETDNAAAPGWIVLRVRDTGSGMPSSVRMNLSCPDLTIKSRREGGRLGLASVRRMVQRAGGGSRSRATQAVARIFRSCFRARRSPRRTERSCQ